MQPKFVQRSATKIAGYLHKTSMSNNTIPAFWQEIGTDGRYEKLRAQDFVAGHNDFGFCVMINDDDMNYYVAREVEKGRDVPNDFQVAVIPAGNYAVFTVPPFPMDEMSPNIADTWGAAYEWLMTSEYTTDGSSSFELYFPNCNCTEETTCEECATGNMTCDIYVKVDM